eukprot:TRINITY_DN2412_c0_g1_i2.p1 TRINITY_DN2412_c0_g1~~TRINITY_DN2412_c0_g1_i2.p1  ORF type:complete len:266 (-),score=58.73 TRINITY_DN2412_c0_g1_i2:21-818(-)
MSSKIWKCPIEKKLVVEKLNAIDQMDTLALDFILIMKKQEKMKKARKQLSVAFGFELDSSSDSEGNQSGNEKRKEEEKTSEQLLNERIKDPNIRQAAFDAGINAAKIAIANGANQRDSLKASEAAIRKVIEEYKPTVTLKEGTEKMLKLRDEIERQEDKRNNRCSVELEINDYPLPAKNKLNDRELMETIQESFGCSISVRGVNVEPAKKAPSGKRKLYVRIEGETQQEVQEAVREIKRLLEETARSAVEQSAGYTNSAQRYSVP